MGGRGCFEYVHIYHYTRPPSVLAQQYFVFTLGSKLSCYLDFSFKFCLNVLLMTDGSLRIMGTEVYPSR